MDVLRPFFIFLRKPDPNLQPADGFNKKQKFLLVYKLSSFGLVSSLIIVKLFARNIEQDISRNSVVDAMINMPMITFFILAVVLGPIMEELVFRLSLVFSRKNLSMTSALVLIFFINLALSRYFSEQLANFKHNYWIFWLSELILTGIFYWLLKKYLSFDFVKKLYGKYYAYVFYFITLSFGFLHIFNYYDFSSVWQKSYLLVLPQIFISFILGYIRIIFGIRWSIITHSLFNFILVLPIIYMPKEIFIANDQAAISSAIEKMPLGNMLMLLVALCLTGIIYLFIAGGFLKAIYDFFRGMKRDRAIEIGQTG